MQPPPEPADNQFLRWRCTGDAQALGECFDRTAPQLLKLAIHLVGDASAAEDLVQATFLALIEQRERLDTSRPIEPWLAGVLTNKARELRRAARRAVDPARLEQRLEEDASAPAERRELHGEVARAVDQLDEPYRQVVLLSLRHAMAPADIAHVLERDAGTVRVQLHRGLEKLRKLLPAALASSLALAAFAPRGLAAVKARVLEQALLAAPVAAGGTLVGGMVVSKLAVAAAAALVAALVWFLNSFEGTPGRAPAAIESAVAPTAPPTKLAAPPAAPTDDSTATQQRAEIAQPALEGSTHDFEIVDALTKSPLAGARVVRHAARTTDVRTLLRERPEAFAMTAFGRLEPRTLADWPMLVGAKDAAFAGRAPLLALDFPGEAEPLERATSDGLGRVSLAHEAGWSLIEVELEGYATRYRPVSPDALPTRIELWPQRRVRGQCWVHGRPYSGAPLELALCTSAPGVGESQHEGVCVARVTTDTAGRFDVTLGGAHGRVRVLSPGWSIAMDTLLSLDGSEWRVELQELQTLRLLDAADGSPLESIHVRARHAKSGMVVWSSLLHAPRGLVTLPGKAGRPGFDGPARFSLWAPGYRAEHVDEPTSPSAEPLELRFEREETALLVGSVLDTGTPLDGVDVTLLAHGPNLRWTPGSFFQRALVDATVTVQGRFALQAPPGVYLLEVRRGTRVHTRVVTHPNAEELLIDFARLASLLVEVVDRSGAPQAGHVVGMNATDQRAERRNADEAGLVRFEDLPSTQGKVFAPNVNTEGSFAADVAEEFVLIEGEQRRVRLVVFGAAAPRRARVVARGASDYSGWRARFGDEPWQELDARGVIPMDLATEQWTGEVRALDGRSWSFDIPKNADDGHVIELDGGEGRARGLVRVTSGASLAGWTIEAQPWSDCTTASRTRARAELEVDGHFDLTGLAPCIHRLRLYDASAKLRAEYTPAPTSDSEPLEILLDPPRGELRLSGIVRRKSGSPIAGALLTIESTTPGAKGVLRFIGVEPLARTDEQGRYSIALPRTAQHEVSVFAEHGQARGARETLLDDGRSERTLDFEID